MSKRDRTTLKSFFRDGALPGAEQYRDLIDSSVNQVEDGFDKTDLDGLRLSSIGSSLRVMSLYEDLGTQTPSWVIEHGNENPGALHVRPDRGKGADVIDTTPGPSPDGSRAAAPGLSLDRRGDVGIGLHSPAWPLDVNGVVRMHGRIGVESPDIPHVPADGRWHFITQPLTGCQAFEVMAGAGGLEGQGRYSLVHAIAMNAYHPRNRFLNWAFRRRRIRAQTAVYGSYADRIRLQWVKDPEPHHFRLRICTNADFGKGRTIQYKLTRLWFDSTMSGSRQGPDRDGDLR
ncbi:MAG: hypothetical protein AAF390_14030 [Pseudomonadota bacterium]